MSVRKHEQKNDKKGEKRMEENTIYDYSILKGKIVEKIGSRRELAEKLGINETTLSNKLNNKTDFSREEMKKICKILDEPLIKIIEYFFTETVRENEQK
jgi:transcriptional regulator with XRE-family HTH domain